MNKPLMHDAMAATHQYTGPWITDRPPPRTGSFLVSIVDPDNWRYTTISVWQEGRWDMLYGRVVGWQEKPEPIRV